jgi:putative CocE/NonD family hydrolase
MFGDSYYGFTQYAAASTGHPALRAIVPRVTTTRIGINDLVRGDGVVDIPWATGAAYLLQCWTGPTVNEREPDWNRHPLTDAFEAEFAALGTRSHWYDITIPHAVPNRMYPEGAPESARPVPTLHCVGWWDNLAIAHLRDVALFASTPGWAPLQYLWLDSIDHENYHIDEAGRVDASTDHDTDAAALEKMMDTYLGPALRFFDVFVKGEGSPDDIPRVQWHLAHDGYRTDASWPPPAAHVLSLSLDGFDAAPGAGGILTATPPAAPPTEPSRVTWRFDPADPVRSPAQSSWSYLREYPDERAAAQRADVIVFDTEPLEQALDLAGPASLWLRVASTAVTADVFARVLDVAPDGAAHLVIRGQAEFSAPDGSTLRRIELGHAGYRLRTGHRLRLQLASSDFPEYPLNPGTGENRWLAAAILPAEHTLTTDAAAPARLDLTVLPAEG